MEMQAMHTLLTDYVPLSPINADWFSEKLQNTSTYEMKLKCSCYFCRWIGQKPPKMWLIFSF